MDNTIKFTVTLTRKDLASTARSFYTLRKGGLSTGVILGIMLFVGLIELWRNGLQPLTFYSIATLLFVVMLVFFLTYIYVIYPAVIARKTLQTEGYPHTVDWLVGEKQINLRAQSTEETVNWEAFGEVLEIRHYFLLVNAENTSVFSIIPKRVFKNAADLERFRMLLKAKIATKEKQPLWKNRWVIFFLICGVILPMLYFMFIEHGR